MQVSPPVVPLAAGSTVKKGQSATVNGHVFKVGDQVNALCRQDDTCYDGRVEAFFLSTKASANEAPISADIIWDTDGTISRAKVDTFELPGKTGILSSSSFSSFSSFSYSDISLVIAAAPRKRGAVTGSKEQTKPKRKKKNDNKEKGPAAASPASASSLLETALAAVRALAAEGSNELSVDECVDAVMRLEREKIGEFQQKLMAKLF